MARLGRRSVLKGVGIATIGTAGLGKSGPAAAAATAPTSLPTVDVTADRVARTIAGLRPYRPSGFVMRRESLDGKLLVHNYGHGGCGVTLSWGTADMAVDLALESPHRRAAVIGCGAVGLATARLLQDRGFQVTIYAEQLPPNTTSNVAAALFGVTSLVGDAHRTAATIGRIQQATRFSHRYFQNFIGARYGVRWIEFFLIGDQPQSLPWEFEITPELFPLTTYDPETQPFPTNYASSIPTLQIQTGIYLRQVLDDFLAQRGTLQVRSFPDPAAIADLDDPVIVNCTGLGSRELFGDPDLVPVKGQLTLLRPQSEVTHAYIDGARDLYMFPRDDVIVLGGSHQEGVWSTDPDPEIAVEIFEGHRRIAAGMH